MALSPTGFQNVVNAKAAPAVEGDFASTNPRASVLAVEGNLVAGPAGVVVGKFAFVNPANQAVSNVYASGDQIGFLGRNEQGLITTFLADSTQVVPPGFMLTLFDEGEFWARFGNGATAGQEVYADELTGAAQSGSGTTSFTGAVGFTGTASFATSVMTLVTVTSGTIEDGDVVTSAGVTAGTEAILLSGTRGAVGSTYALSTTPGTIAAQAATTTSFTLSVTAISAGSINVGDIISGTNVTAGTVILAFGTGVGGVGTYTLGVPGGVAFHTASETITVPPGAVDTGFKVRTNCLPGELAIISSWGV